MTILIAKIIQSIAQFLESLFPKVGTAVTNLNYSQLIGEAEVRDAVQSRLSDAEGFPQESTRALVAQSKLETGNWSAWYFQGAQPDGRPPTYNLWNRHKGSGRGVWTGQTRYVSKADPDVRIYTDIYQCALDFRQLLHDPLYSRALQALKDGDANAYALALERAGYSATPNYAQSVLNVYGDLA